MDSQVIDTEAPAREMPTEEAPQVEGAGDEAKPGMDLPSALAALEEANRKIREVNRESATRRKEIADLKAQLASGTTSKEEVTTSLAELKGQLQVANDRLRTYAQRDAFDLAIVKAKIPFVNPTAARDAFAFAQEQIGKLPEGFSDDDVLDIVKEVVKLRPYLLNKPVSPNINADAKGATDALSGINMDDIARDFGISTH